MKFSDRLKEIRIKKGLLQGELAKLAGITPPNLSNYEHGVREPSISILVKIAVALDVSSDYLLGLEKEEIKRCPLCGGKPEIGRDSTHEKHFIFCRECFCSSGRYSMEALAIEKWNKRAR